MVYEVAIFDKNSNRKALYYVDYPNTKEEVYQMFEAEYPDDGVSVVEYDGALED